MNKAAFDHLDGWFGEYMIIVLNLSQPFQHWSQDVHCIQRRVTSRWRLYLPVQGSIDTIRESNPWYFYIKYYVILVFY
jgi:hypothetical protein